MKKPRNDTVERKNCKVCQQRHPAQHNVCGLCAFKFRGFRRGELMQRLGIDIPLKEIGVRRMCGERSSAWSSPTTRIMYQGKVLTVR